MRILLTTDVIHAGGAETFVLRLAQALHEAGHQVTVYPLYKKRVDSNIIKAFAPDVAVVPARLPLTRLLQIVDGAFRRLKVDVSLVNFFLIWDLKKRLKQYNIEVIHSHLFTADWVAVQAAAPLQVPVVSTIHGDYRNYSSKLDAGVPILIRNYRKKAYEVLKRLCAVVCISDEQLTFFKTKFPHLSLNTHRIYNGYQASCRRRALTRQEVGIGAQGFVFGMVARGIPEKGWETVIQAFNAAQLPDAYLLLVGNSDYVRALKATHANTSIIFAGYSSNPIEYITLFDVGLFASTYASESLPTVLIEYLSCDVPVISVAVAECKNMLQSPAGPAGLLVDLQDGKVPVAAFANAMKRMYTDKTVYHQLRANTRAALKKFDMPACVQAYEAIYRSCLGSG